MLFSYQLKDAYESTIPNSLDEVKYYFHDNSIITTLYQFGSSKSCVRTF